jgi:RNA polymerase sigma factor (sigma-70 family)
MPERLSGEARQRIVGWISREILPHETSIRRWLTRALDAATVEDVIQESYCRIAALPDISHIRSGRAYFFMTARSLVLQQIRRQRVVRIETVAEIEAFDMAQEAPSPERIVAGRRELSHVMELIQALPERCRQIMDLRKIQGLSQNEVAVRLNIPAHIVENDIAKGLRLIAKALAQHEELAERQFGRIGEEQRTRDGRNDQ